MQTKVRKQRFLKGEARFEIRGKVEVLLSKLPGKRGLISSYPDSWGVVIAITQDANITTFNLTGFEEDAAKIRGYYECLQYALARNEVAK